MTRTREQGQSGDWNKAGTSRDDHMKLTPPARHWGAGRRVRRQSQQATQDTSSKWAGRLDHAQVAVGPIGNSLVSSERKTPAGVGGEQGDAVTAAIAADENDKTRDAWVKKWVSDPADVEAEPGGAWVGLEVESLKGELLGGAGAPKVVIDVVDSVEELGIDLGGGDNSASDGTQVLGGRVGRFDEIVTERGGKY
jgi:hypothetical protein